MLYFLTTVVALGWLLPALTRASNCGGNTAALTACRGVWVGIQVLAAEGATNPIAIARLTKSERIPFGSVPGLRWLAGATVLVAPEVSVSTNGRGKQILAVCNRAYTNVPRRWFGSAAPSHAVVYTDGTTALLSEVEFRRLDLGGFVDVRTIPDGNDFQPTGSAPEPSRTDRARGRAGDARSP